MQRGDLIAERFQIDQHAASGGMGEVFRARDIQSGATVAVKLLHGGLRDQGARFDREGLTLARLSHPGIVRYVAHGIAPTGEAYLAMEWLEGEDLASRLSRGKLSLADSLTLATRVAEAVHAAHASGIVHRDLKPSNIFLVEGRLDRVKVLDFGIARMSVGTRLTATGMMIGTPGYMSPEQAAADRPIDVRSDVFALGCVLFECLTGVYAFAAEHPMALLAKVMFADPQRLRDVLPAAPAALDALLWRMLAKDPAARPPHGEAVAAALAALGSHGAADGAAQPAGALTLDEQRMFSVVLLGGEASSERETASDEALLLEETRPLAAAPVDQPARQGAAVWGGQLELLRDGSLAVALGGSGLVTDRAAQAARCALWLRTHAPGRPMALATGRGDRAGRLPAAETIDRAAALLVSGTADGIAIDEVTARLLDARFDVREHGGRYVLHGEHELGEGIRTLLGRPTPCVGRDVELRTLAQLFEECVEEPARRAALVTAPPGTGKSRLAQELLRAIQARGAPVAVWSSRGEPHRAGSAFNLLAQLLRSACGIQGGEPLEEQRNRLAARVAARPEGRRIAEFLGEIAGTPFPDDDSLPLRAARQDAQLMTEQLRAAFLDFLRAETAAAPVVLVLEDLHWGDDPTVQFIDLALRELHDRPLFVLALARPEVHALFPDLWAERQRQTLPLKQLGKKASERLVRHVLGEGAERALVERLVQLSEGNAFYLEELIRAAAEGQLSDHPETVVAMVQSRLDALDDDARRTLRAAAVLGEVFWAGAVAHLLGGAEHAAELGARLAELLRRELIVLRKQGRFPDEAEYTFRHALLREGAYASLTDEDRALGHRLAGAWLEAHGEQDPLALAEHFARGGDGARAALHYLRAAEQAVLGGDATAVLARAQRALSYDMPEELRMRCLGMLCELHHFRMDLQNDARTHAEEVLRRAPRGSTPWCQGMILQLVRTLETGDLEELVRLAELAAETAPAPGAATVWVLCVSIGIFMLDALGHARRTDHLLRAFVAGHQLVGEAEPGASVFFHSLLAVRTAYAEEDPLQGLFHAEALARTSKATGQRRYAEIAKIFIGMNRWCLGILPGTDRIIMEVTLPDSDIGLASSYRPFVLGWLLADRGSLDEARREADGLIEAGRARRLPVDEGRGHWLRAEVLRRAGELDGASAAAEASLALMRATAPLDVPGALATLAAVRRAQGRLAEALAAATEALALYEASTTCAFFRGAFLRLVHAECLEAAGDHAAAQVAIGQARARVLGNAAKIDDLEYRRCFLEEVPENRRTLELARAWLGPIASS